MNVKWLTAFGAILLFCCSHNQAENGYSRIIRIVDTSSVIGKLFLDKDYAGLETDTMCGQYIVGDSTEPQLFMGPLAEPISLHLYGKSPYSRDVPKSDRESMFRSILAEQQRLSSDPKTPLNVMSSCPSNASPRAALYISPIKQGMAVACLLHIVAGRGDTSLTTLQSYNEGVVLFFEFDEEDNITNWTAKKVTYD